MSRSLSRFDDGGKDKFARRALFTTFCNLVAPEKWSLRDKADMNFEEGCQFAGFRKSAGIWYQGEKKDECWDRRLVLWIKSQDGTHLPFFDTKGELVTINGKPLVEAGVCTLEVVLRNFASYTIGFLLAPKYKAHQDEAISKASSWIVIGYFPFPDCTDGPVKMVDGCVTDQAKVTELLLAHSHHPSKTKRSEKENLSDDEEQDYMLATDSKRTYKKRLRSQKKRRNIEHTSDDNDIIMNQKELLTTSSSPMDGSECMKNEIECFRGSDDICSWTERKTDADLEEMKDGEEDCKDMKEPDHYDPYPADSMLYDTCGFDLVNDEELQLFPNSCVTTSTPTSTATTTTTTTTTTSTTTTSDFSVLPPSSSPTLLFSDPTNVPMFYDPCELLPSPFFTTTSASDFSFLRTDSTQNLSSFPWLNVSS